MFEEYLLFPSAEIRWFGKGRVSAAMKQWFEIGKQDKPERRSDYYLRLDCETVGVKLRGPEKKTDGNFEVKALRGFPELIQISDVYGRCDTWVKWSNEDASLQSWLDTLTADRKNWLSVQKTRWLRQFLVEGEKLTEVSEDPAQGCKIEITQLKVGSTLYWTIGFEASAEAQEVRAVLNVVAARFLSTKPTSISLSYENSYAYPTWLNLLRKQKV